MHVRADCAVLLLCLEPKPMGQTGISDTPAPSAGVLSVLAALMANGHPPVKDQGPLLCRIYCCHQLDEKERYHQQTLNSNSPP